MKQIEKGIEQIESAKELTKVIETIEELSEKELD